MKITIYTITDCQFSKQEKEYLVSHNLPYEEKNLETNHEFLTEMLNVSNNFAGTPVTKLEKDDGNIVVLKGFTAEEFDKELGFKKEETKSEAPAKTEEPAKMEAAPQPPTPAPMPPTPMPPTPETPIAPPTIPDQSAQPANMAMPQTPPADSVSSMGSQPPMTDPSQQPPQAPQPESTVDDASLDAILSQLQEKTAETPTESPPPASTPPPPASNPPTIPDFGSST